MLHRGGRNQAELASRWGMSGGLEKRQSDEVVTEVFLGVVTEASPVTKISILTTNSLRYPRPMDGEIHFHLPKTALRKIPDYNFGKNRKHSDPVENLNYYVFWGDFKTCT